MTYPGKKETIAILTRWKSQYEAVDKLMESVEASLGLDINGPLFDTVWCLVDAYKVSIAAQVGDPDDWLEWYQSETDMGKRTSHAGYDGKLRKIKTLDSLWPLIEESRKRRPAP